MFRNILGRGGGASLGGGGGTEGEWKYDRLGNELPDSKHFNYHPEDELGRDGHASGAELDENGRPKPKPKPVRPIATVENWAQWLDRTETASGVLIDKKDGMLDIAFGGDSIALPRDSLQALHRAFAGINGAKESQARGQKDNPNNTTIASDFRDAETQFMVDVFTQKRNEKGELDVNGTVDKKRNFNILLKEKRDENLAYTKVLAVDDGHGNMHIPHSPNSMLAYQHGKPTNFVPVPLRLNANDLHLLTNPKDAKAVEHRAPETETDMVGGAVGIAGTKGVAKANGAPATVDPALEIKPGKYSLDQAMRDKIATSFGVATPDIGFNQDTGIITINDEKNGGYWTAERLEQTKKHFAGSGGFVKLGDNSSLSFSVDELKKHPEVLGTIKNERDQNLAKDAKKLQTENLTKAVGEYNKALDGAYGDKHKGARISDKEVQGILANYEQLGPDGLTLTVDRLKRATELAQKDKQTPAEKLEAEALSLHLNALGNGVHKTHKETHSTNFANAAGKLEEISKESKAHGGLSKSDKEAIDRIRASMTKDPLFKAHSGDWGLSEPLKPAATPVGSPTLTPVEFGPQRPTGASGR